MSFTDRLLQKTDVRDFYGRYTKLRKLPGKPECKGLCPLHEEKTPSFSVNLETGSFYCFGCTEGGGPVQFEAKRQGISTKEACKRLSAEFGLKGDSRKDAKTQSQRRKEEDSPPQLTTDNRQLTTILQSLLDAGRPLDDKAVAFFARRKIHPETLDRFQIAFLADPRKTEDALLRQFEPEALLASGAFQKARSGNLRFAFLNHPLLFPILNSGRPVWLQGRRLYPDQSKRKYSNLAGVQVPGLFNADRLRDLSPQSPLYLCEGAPDTMILEQEGIPAVGIVGVGAFKPEWIPQLEPFQIHLALDNDTAGKSGGERIRQLLHEHDLPVRIVSLPDEYNDINDLVAARGAEAFKQCADQAELQSPDLVTIVKSLRRRISDHSDDFDLTDLGERIYRWFESNGGMFFCGRNKRTHLLFEKKLYRIGDNDDFNALMMRKARLLSNLRQSRGLWVALHTFCVMEGRRQTTLNWCWADKLKGEVYLNLHNESHQLVRIAPGQVEVCLNGDNPAGVLLGEADKMLPIEYQPDATPREAVELLKELVIDALACRPRNRLLLTSWLLSAFFLDFAPHKGMMKLSGPTKSGKSTAGQILTTLLYGTAQVENPTVAYSYTDTSRNPLLVCDNMENQQLTLSVIQFLLGVATGASRSKREAGTRDGVVREPVHALVALTAIEPLPKSELINRFYEVEFDKIFKRGGFLPDVHLKRLEAARNRILSGLFQLFSREVLPGFLSSRQTLMHRLEASFPEHSKDRTNSFLTIVVLIMRSLLKLLEGLADPDARTWEILTEVIKEQGEIAEDTERETNPATYLLDALAHEVRTKGSGLVDKQYYVQSQAVVDEAGELKEVHLVAPAKDFYMAFVTLSRNRGYAVPFLNAKSLMARINSEKEALAASGWRWKREKTVNGYQHHRFVKAMVRAPIEETPEGSPPTGGE